MPDSPLPPAGGAGGGHPVSTDDALIVRREPTPHPSSASGRGSKVAVLISGRGSNMQALVEQADCYDVALVAADNPDAAGLAWATANGVATFTRNVREIGRAAWETALIDRLRAGDIHYIALAGYMRLLTPAFIAVFPNRIVNIHPSLLPAHKGLDTHARALAAGDTEHGCSVHIVTADLDAGEVLGQARVPVLPGDTPDTLAARVLFEEHRLYPRVLAEWLAR